MMSNFLNDVLLPYIELEHGKQPEGFQVTELASDTFDVVIKGSMPGDTKSELSVKMSLAESLELRLVERITNRVEVCSSGLH